VIDELKQLPISQNRFEISSRAIALTKILSRAIALAEVLSGAIVLAEMIPERSSLQRYHRDRPIREAIEGNRIYAEVS
jgi:hypothetical protein